MKPIKKPAKTAPVEKPKSSSELLDDVRSDIIQLGVEIEQIKYELNQTIKTRIDNAGTEFKDFVTGIAREHFNKREESIVRRLFEFFQLDLLWETKTVYTGASNTRSETEALLNQGWMYVTTVYDGNQKDVTKRNAAIYRRHVIPKTFEEFKGIYDKYLREEKAAKEKAKAAAEKRNKVAAEVDAAIKVSERKIKKLAKKTATE